MRRGFTLIELLIGLALTAILLTALAAITFAASLGWRNTEHTNTAVMTNSQIQARLGKYLYASPRLGGVRRGSLDTTGQPAAMFLWKLDETSIVDPAGDGRIEFNEIGLLIHDRASRQLRLYDASDWASWTPSAKAAANLLAGSPYIDTIANAADFMAACPNYRVVMNDVQGLVFATTVGERPIVEFVIKLQDSAGQSSVHYGTLSLRAIVSPGN